MLADLQASKNVHATVQPLETSVSTVYPAPRESHR
jgi:hypothetical protein